MQLSVVFVNWNSARLLDDSLGSLERTAGGIEHEAIVIDSGSFDGCGQMLQSRHPGVRFVQSEKNLGFGRANNVAARLATGDRLLFLNPDTLLTEGAVSSLMRALDETPNAGIAGPRLLNADGSVQTTCVRALPTLLNQLLDANLLRRRYASSALWGMAVLEQPGESPQPVEAVSGACMLIPRALFEAVGGFSEQYFMYSEDMDLCLAVARRGRLVLYVPQATVVHLGGASSAKTTSDTFSAVMRVESQWRFFRKNRSAFYAGSYRVGMAAASMARLAALMAAWSWRALTQGERHQPAAVSKWAARLRWTLGGERWVRDY